MPKIVVYDEGASPQKVLRVTGDSENQGFWDDSGRTDFLVNPDLTAVAAVPVRYWKVVGSSVVAMTAGEQTAQDNAQASAVDAATRQSGKDVKRTKRDTSIHARADSFVTREELNRVMRAVRQLTDAIKDGTGGTTNLRTDVANWAAGYDLTNVTKAEWNTQLNAFIDSMDLDDPDSDA